MSNNIKNIFAVIFLIPALSVASISNIQTPEDKTLARAFAAYMDGNDKAALTYFEEVVRLNPKNRAAQKGLEKVKARLHKMEDEKQRQARKLAEAKMREGRRYLKTGDNVAAIDCFHIAIDAVPGYKAAINELKKIKADVTKISKKTDFNPSAWSFARGTLAYLDRDWAKAYRIWSERSRIEPANIPLANATARAENNFRHMMLTEQEDFFRRGARAFYEQGLYTQAKHSWEKVVELRRDDLEALDGVTRAQDAIARAEGKGKTTEVQTLLEQGLESYASQKWSDALEIFKQINQMDPTFSAAGEYIAKINNIMTAVAYTPVHNSATSSWRESKPSNAAIAPVHLPVGVENYAERRMELESQKKRDPSNIKIQQELDKIVKMQEDESERIYKDGLIAYSQGNRGSAIEKWKQVLIIFPDHKKAEAALRKARAEEERTARDLEQ